MTTKLYNRNDLGDILTTAVEGGIGYWATVLEYTRDQEGRYTRVVLQDAEDPSAGEWVVVLNSIEAAVNLVRTYEDDVVVNSEIREDILSGDAGRIDADGADVLVQLACFGAITYG